MFGPGAALVDDGTAWVLVEDEPARGLGPALAWAVRQRAGTVNVLAERETGLLARRAGEFAFPVHVWRVDRRTLHAAEPADLTAPPPAPGAHLALIPTIEAGGATPVVEHGVVAGEVRGLEVCRVVDDADTGAVRLDVGVGVHDREAFAIIHGDVPTVDALAGVVAAVAEHRGDGTAGHPLNRLAPERLLRWSLEQEPALIGLTSLAPAPPPRPRHSLKEPAPCSALGFDPAGRTVLVVCSVGVDLDLIPYAADARRAAESEPGVGLDVMVVVPPRDLMPITAELAGLLRHAVTLVLSPVPSSI
ncbi:MAG: hypothetical protein H0U21_12930 [Acidimicrobiia bacterium]|nr:hypothetical protein [Acidimicrobiia bacterium]